MNATNASTAKLKGVHVLWLMIGFFTSIIAVDVAFSIAAINTFPGEEEKHSYVQGLHFNDTLRREQAERALGWRAAAGFENGATPSLIIELRDRSGAPIEAVLQGELRRPVDARLDRDLRFTALGQGRYRAEAASLAPGAWDLRAEAVHLNEHFSIERRLTWRPSAQP